MAWIVLSRISQGPLLCQPTYISTYAYLSKYHAWFSLCLGIAMQEDIPDRQRQHAPDAAICRLARTCPYYAIFSSCRVRICSRLALPFSAMVGIPGHVTPCSLRMLAGCVVHCRASDSLQRTNTHTAGLACSMDKGPLAGVGGSRTDETMRAKDQGLNLGPHGPRGCKSPPL